MQLINTSQNRREKSVYTPVGLTINDNVFPQIYRKTTTKPNFKLKNTDRP